MGLHAPMFYDQPVELVRGEGVWLYDSNDNRYLDLYNNVPCVGHANPRVADAMHRQMSTLNVHSRYLHETVVAYAEQLTALHPDGLDSMVFTCTGSEANEVAMKIARGATGGRGIIGTDGTYHGNTPEVAKLTHLDVDERRNGVRSIATPQTFRPLADGLDEDALCDLHIEQLEQQIRGFEEDGIGFAGLLLCSILANEGLPNPPRGFFRRAVESVRKAGGLIIADEVQAGFGRSGSWWGYETNDFVPDIVTMGKPMGNGLPVAATIASHELVTAFRANNRYFNTFAASPLQAAAGAAVIDEIEDRSLVAQVDAVGRRIQAGLRELQVGEPRIGDVRGHGMFIGMDWVLPGTTEPDLDGAAAMVEAMKARRMLLARAGQHRNVLKIRPPLVFDHEHADLFLAEFAEAIDQVPAGPTGG